MQGIFAAGNHLITEDGTYAFTASLHSIDANGVIQSVGNDNITPFSRFWSAAADILYYNDDTGTIYALPLSSSGVFGTRTVLNDYTTPVFAGQITANPQGTLVLNGTGRLFDSSTLQYAGTLNEMASASLWKDSDLFTTIQSDTNVTLRRRETTTFTALTSVTLSGQTLGLYSLPGRQILLITRSSGAIGFWTLSADDLSTISHYSTQGPVGTAPTDLGGDGVTDVVWRNAITGQLASWTSEGYFSNLGSESGGWTMIGAGDFDGDGWSELLWRNTSTGVVASWTLAGNYIVWGTETPTLKAVCAADFDGDNMSEVVWRDTSTGQLSVNTSLGKTRYLGQEGSGWTAIDAGDIDGDGVAEVVWRNTQTGTIAAWTSKGIYRNLGTEGDGWTVIDVGDFDGDGKADLLWRNTTTGAIASWTSSGRYANLGTESDGWSVAR